MNEDDRLELEALLAGRAAGGLDRSEQERLRELLATVAPADLKIDLEGYDLLAAEIAAAVMAEVEDPMPAELATRIVQQGETAVHEAARGATGPTLVEESRPPAAAPKTTWITWSGWAVAAALGALWLSDRPAASPTAPALGDVRSALLASAGAVEIPWAGTEDPAATSASGDVVWSEVDQDGVMRFRGLEPNDPAQSRYQLWIFDADRDARFPVDGGLFDVPADAEEVLVPIDARLRVNEPTLFAVTVELPDGVVVSDRERIVMVAQTGAGVPGQ